MHDRAPFPAGGATRVAGVMAEIRARIASRRLAAGAKLPSVRDFAATAGVSKSTVVEAYERLAAEGAITSRAGSGFYVAGATRPLSLQSLRPDLDRPVSPRALDATLRALERLPPPEPLGPARALNPDRTSRAD